MVVPSPFSTERLPGSGPALAFQSDLERLEHFPPRDPTLDGPYFKASFLRGDIRLRSAGARGAFMNEDQVKGVGEKVKGKINEGVGKMTDDPAQEAKGDAQQIAGEARKQVGNAEEEAKDAADEAVDRDPGSVAP
jgi:uncharacterized protein YjbJ (UPF0337 family)